MSRSTCWSLLAFALALISAVMHRDISANIFMATFLIIQGLKRPKDWESDRHWRRARLLINLVSIGLIVFALSSLATGMNWAGPKPW